MLLSKQQRAAAWAGSLSQLPLLPPHRSLRLLLKALTCHRPSSWRWLPASLPSRDSDRRCHGPSWVHSPPPPVTSKFLQRPQCHRIRVSDHKRQSGHVIRPLKCTTLTCEILSTGFMNFHTVSHEALANILIKTLFVVMHRPVWRLVNEIIQ
jgi:hypothetical protein